MAQMMTADVADGRIIDYKAIVVFSALSMVMFVGVPLFGYFFDYSCFECRSAGLPTYGRSN